MKLHDPDTEKELIHIARNVVGPAGFVKPEFSLWSFLFRVVFVPVAIIYVLSIITALVVNDAFDFQITPEGRVLRDGICAVVMMFFVRRGLDRVAVEFRSACFFGTLANLPIHGRTALTHIRGVIFRRYWFTPLFASFIAAICLHLPFDPKKCPDIVLTWVMLTAILWATLGIMQFGWLHRLRCFKIWNWAAYCVIAYVVILYVMSGRLFLPQAAVTAMDQFIISILWLFPPAWVFPEMSAKGGFIPAAIWIAWGGWSWLRWPERMFPGYDRPFDFIGAFGGIGITGQVPVSDPESACGNDPIVLEAAPRPPTNGWVDRIINASILADDQAVAGSLMAAKNHTGAINMSMIFAVVWLLVIGFGKNLIQEMPVKDLILTFSWLLPAIVFAFSLLPLGNPLKSAVLPCPAGNTPVPFFTMLPVTLRSLLRITLRIVIVRTVIAVAIATPFFWILAKILGLADVGVVIIAMIPAIGIAWILSVPAILANQLDSHLRRRKGIFPLILATSLVQVPIYMLWIMAAIAGVGVSATWGMENSSGPYAFLLLPVAIGCFALSAVMSWLIFEILHLSLRQRRYDWKSKIR